MYKPLSCTISAFGDFRIRFYRFGSVVYRDPFCPFEFDFQVVNLSNLSTFLIIACFQFHTRSLVTRISKLNTAVVNLDVNPDSTLTRVLYPIFIGHFGP